MRFTKSQIGSKGKTNYGRMGNGGSKIIPPWGPILPWNKNRSSGVGQSSRKPLNPSPSEAPQTAGYPANKPGEWPVEPDYVNHTHTPSSSGLNAQTAARHNVSVEQAYTRAHYQ